jgi:peptidoglycan/LPS O-acetylase OafA/YrhL
MDLKHKLNALTGLRFFAAFSIVILHSVNWFLPAEPLLPWPLGQGVSFFFVLSGFILVYVYPELPDAGSVLSFWLARFARVWPAHSFAILLTMVLAGAVVIDGDLTQLAANLLLVHAWVPERFYFFSYNLPSWSVSTEVGFYAVFPLLIYRLGHSWWWKLVATAGLVVGIFVVSEMWSIPVFESANPYGITAKGLFYINPLGRVFEFTLGMCTCLLWRSARLKGGVMFWTVLESAAVLLVLWNMRHGTSVFVHYATLSPFPMSADWMRFSGSCISFALLIFVMAKGAGLIGKTLSTAPLVFLGEISYSVYLLHHVLLNAYVAHRGQFGLVPKWALFPLFVTTVLVLSSAVFLLIEQPARRWMRGSFRNPSQQRTSALIGQDATSAPTTMLTQNRQLTAPAGS